MKELGVIIPTYNRLPILLRLLDILEKQTLGQDFFCVTIVDDGSTDETSDELKKRKWNLDIQIITQENAKQAKARNTGIKATEAKYILFLGDDMLPSSEDFLQKHLEALRDSDGRTAFLGFTTWHPDLPESQFRTWLENGGPQFDYRGLEDSSQTDFWHFYTANISLPKVLLDRENFDEKFAGYGWEDIELAYRLVKNSDLKIFFLKDARVYHWHELEEKSVWQRVPEMKKAAEYFEKKHPEIKILPHGLKWLVIRVFTISPVVWIASKIKPEWGWYLRFKREFL